MPLKITFELSDKDLEHFRKEMQSAQEHFDAVNEADVISATRGVIEKVSSVDLPDFIADRVERLKELVDMLEDEEWDLPEDMRPRVLNALAYFSDPHDLIPDNIPGVGFLDDAIMIELVVRDLRHELEAYQDFLRFREGKRKAAEWAQQVDLATRREQLRQRIRRRRGRSRRGYRTKGSSFSLW